MSEEVQLTSVTKESGEILFIYADKYNVYVVYRPDTRKIAYLAVCDKRLYIERVDILDVPDWVFDYEQIRFFRPRNNNSGDITFPGTVTVGKDVWRFEIFQNAPAKLEHCDEAFDPAVKQAYHLLPVLEGYDVTHGIQSREKFYFVGIDKHEEGNYHPVYGVVDMVSGGLETVYYLYSDKGEIDPACVTLDVHERVVYVVGKTIVFDNAHNVVDHIPYIEQFMLRV